MKTVQGLLVAGLALCALTSLPASAQGTACSPQISCQLTVGQNLAVDSGFEFGCPAWYFAPGSRRENPGPCSSGTNGYCPNADALMTLSSATATYFQQDINLAPTGCRLDPYRVSFLIHVSGTSPSTWDKVFIEVVNPYTNTVLQTLGVYDSRTLYDWTYQQLPVSPTSNWPQWVRLRFRATFATGSAMKFRFDEVKFWGI